MKSAKDEVRKILDELPDDVSIEEIQHRLEVRRKVRQGCDPDEIAALERRWAAVEAGAKTVPHERVVRWLETWGTSAFQPRSKR